MDIDFCSTRLHSVKQLSSRYNFDGCTRAFFPCPFCYVEIEIQGLCNHLQDEHCFDIKNAVCPLCAASLGKDVTGHFIVQHTSSLKHRRKSQKYGLWTENTVMLGKEMSSFLGLGSERANSCEAETDQPMLPLPGSRSYSTGRQQDESSEIAVSVSSHLKSGMSSVEGSNEVNSDERRQRAAFVQELVESTIF